MKTIHFPFQNCRFLSANWLKAAHLVARIRRAYTVAFPTHPAWEAEDIPLTIWGIRQALLRLNKRFREHLFPLAFEDRYLERLNLACIPDDFLSFIPIDCVGYDITFREPGHYLNYSAPYDFLIFCAIKELVSPERIESYFGDSPYPYVFEENWHIKDQLDCFEQASLPYPLANLGLALQAVCGSTGNPWIDCDIDALWEYPEEVEIVQWQPENIKRLQALYQEAVEIKHELSILERYFAHNGQQKLRALLVALQVHNRKKRYVFPAFSSASPHTPRWAKQAHLATQGLRFKANAFTNASP